MSASKTLIRLTATAVFAVSLANSGDVAADVLSPISVTVKFSDLDISNPAGAQALYTRIRAAAIDACAHYWFERDADETRCVHDAIADAVNKVDESALTAIFDTNYKGVSSLLVSERR
jgi:UrcA family protein